MTFVVGLRYTGSRSSVYRFTRYLIEGSNEGGASRTSIVKVEVWSARKTARLLTKPSDTWSADEKAFLNAFFQICPDAKKSHQSALEFQNMMKQKKPELLDSWIKSALNSGIENLRRFAVGLQQDYDAVKAAMTLEWSNGQVEGQVNRLKTIKRQMYGRAGFKLLRKRILFRSG